eukprot:1388005-Rhodomonas_salina.1
MVELMHYQRPTSIQTDIRSWIPTGPRALCSTSVCGPVLIACMRLYQMLEVVRSILFKSEHVYPVGLDDNTFQDMILVRSRSLGSRV